MTQSDGAVGIADVFRSRLNATVGFLQSWSTGSSCADKSGTTQWEFDTSAGCYEQKRGGVANGYYDKFTLNATAYTVHNCSDSQCGSCFNPRGYLYGTAHRFDRLQSSSILSFTFTSQVLLRCR